MGGLTFIPQQLWEPQYYPFGIETICLHINHSGKSLLQKVEKHLKSGASIIRFSEAQKYKAGKLGELANCLFRPYFRLRNSINLRGRKAKAAIYFKNFKGAFIKLFDTDKKE
jgi:hypothetical protein